MVVTQTNHSYMQKPPLRNIWKCSGSRNHGYVRSFFKDELSATSGTAAVRYQSFEVKIPQVHKSLHQPNEKKMKRERKKTNKHVHKLIFLQEKKSVMFTMKTSAKTCHQGHQGHQVGKQGLPFLLFMMFIQTV